MKKFFTLIFLFIFLLVQTFPLGVDTEELIIEGRIEFENYPGDTDEIYTDREVRNMGKALAKETDEDNKIGWYLNKYTAVHAFDKEQLDKNGADIISIEKVKESAKYSMIITGN